MSLSSGSREPPQAGGPATGSGPLSAFLINMGVPAEGKGALGTPPPAGHRPPLSGTALSPMLLAALAPDPRRWTSPWRRQSGGCNGEARSLSALRSRGQAGLNVGGKETVSQEEEPRSVVLPPRVDESCKPSPRWALRAGTLRSARLRLPAPANLGSERRESNDAGRRAPRALPPPPGFVLSLGEPHGTGRRASEP